MPSIGIAFGFIVLCVSAGFVCYAFTIRYFYPDLNDPSPNVDAYWPSVEHAIAWLIAGVAALIGLPIIGFSTWCFTKRRSKSAASGA
ncbi:MAG TPA: hypothetical protein P5307_15695 [Pirellulaceae bacterium]|nr:hypothetical protein [Pirellulaceae bacterium]